MVGLAKIARAREVTEAASVLGAETNMYHTATSAVSGQGVLNGINPMFFNSETRFGEAFYISEVPDTTLAELAYHDAIGVDTIRFSYNPRNAKVLDLTKTRIAKSWGYVGGDDYTAAQAIAEKAQQAGYNAIRYPSARGQGANLAIFDNFDKILTPQMIVPTPSEQAISQLPAFARGGY